MCTHTQHLADTVQRTFFLGPLLRVLRRGLSNVQICLHSCRVIVLDVFFLLLLCFMSYILVPLAQFWANAVLWTPVSARILALVQRRSEGSAGGAGRTG